MRTRTATAVRGERVHACARVCAAALSETSVRLGEKDASRARPDTRLRFSPFLAFQEVLVLLSLSGGRCRSRRGPVLGGGPPPRARATHWVWWGLGIPSSHPGFLIPGRCQLLSPPQLPALYWEPGWGHPETRGPGQAGLSGQGDFCLKINGEAKLLIIRLGGR